MRNIFLVSVILLSTYVTACSPVPSTAGKYKEKIEAEKKATEAEGGFVPGPSSGDQNTGDGQEPAGGGSTPAGGQEPAGGGSTPAGGGSTPAGGGSAPAGDATKGAALLQACGGCHDSGIAKSVKLDKTAIAKLDAAYTGKQKPIHSSMKDPFVTSRADLEAALATK